MRVQDCGFVCSTRNKAEHADIIRITQELVDNDGIKVGQDVIACSNRYLTSLESGASSSSRATSATTCSNTGNHADMPSRRVMNDQACCQAIQQIVNHVMEIESSEDVIRVLKQLNQLINEHDLKLDPVYIHYLRAYLLANGVIYSYNNSYDVNSGASTYIAEVI